MPDPDLFLFVSHVSEDRQAALEIVDELEQRGVPCWIAPRDVRPGKPFDDEIAEAIEASRAMLLIFSDRCNEHEYIRREITVAGESRKVIIPFRIEDAQPRRGLRVRLSDLHWIDGFVSRERAIDQVVKTIDPTRVRQQEEERRRAEEGRRPPRGTASSPAPEAGASPPADQGRTPAARGRTAPVPGKRTPPSGGERAAAARRLFLRRPTNAICVIAAVLAVLLAPVVVWMLVFRQIPGPPMPTLAVPSPAAKVSAADALQKGKKAYEQKDYAEAMRWYRKAADEDNADAQNKIGALYANGWGMALDYAEAMRWFRKAADQGYANAQFNIGQLYNKGWGVAQDHAEAMRWYQKAADQGYADAQTNIGWLYENGLGVAQDYAEAMRWFRKAADQGNAAAQNNIGFLYDKGWGVAQDYAEAMRWYQKAADQGNATAQENIRKLMIFR